MAEPHKGASEHASETDLLGSWRSTVMENNVLDFTPEAASHERKRAFDFGKLEEFELDAEFSKMSTFKMDMTDLGFSSPLKKTEWTKMGNDTTSGKFEGNKDEFPFSFDFNELDSFDLDMNIVKGNIKPQKCSENRVLRHYENEVSIFPNLVSKSSSNSKDKASSNRNLDTANFIAIAPAELERCSISQKDAVTLPEKLTTTNSQREGKTNHPEGEMHIQVVYPLTVNSEKTDFQISGQEFSKQTCESSMEDPIQQFQNAVAPLPIVSACSREDKHCSSVISEDNIQGVMNIPTYDSKGLLEPHTVESVSITKAPEKSQCEQKNVGQSCVFMCQNEKKNIGENKWRSSIEVFKSSLRRNLKTEQVTVTKKVENNGVKWSSLHKSQATQPSSATVMKHLHVDLHPDRGKRKHNGDKDQNGTHNSDAFKLLRTPNVHQSAVEGGWSNGDKSDNNNLPNHRISLQRTDNKRNISNVNMSRIKSSDKYLSSSIVKEIKLLGTAEEEMVKHPKISSIATHSVKKEKSGVHHQPLKEKKGSELDLFASNALREILESLKGSDMVLLASSNSKCTFESPRERNPSHISPTLGKEGQGSEIIGGFENNMYPDHHSSLLEDNVNGKIMTLGVSVTIENDENMEKAEAYGKEIENIQIRAMLRKKHEEAKELLVRALVNSNSLLMLDNPAYEEQILQLQNFVADLLLKK